MNAAHRLATPFVLAVVLLTGPLVGQPGAQENQPVYPAYEGFMKNPDGSLTLSFGYFSHNAKVVTIPIGPDNAFAQSPVDRQQPTVFKPGHHERQCVMVVPGDFDGKLVWNLAYAGKSTPTSTRMIQSNWFIVEAAEELAKTIHYAVARRGVCLNRAPEVRVLGRVGRGKEARLATVMAVGVTESLFGSVNDEGLPRGKALTASWKQLSGPGTSTFENRNAARTHVVFPAAGDYVLELTGSDSELVSSTEITVNVR